MKSNQKPGNIGATIRLSEAEHHSLKEAVKLSPKLSDLSEPFICDNGRTRIYFKPGADVQQMGERFLAERNRKISM